MKRNHLDEMQERQVLRIEHHGCWLVFWGLLLAIVGQMILWPQRSFQNVVGEWIVFMTLALYLSISHTRQGIWDRKWQANHGTNLLVSLGAALVTGGITAVMMWQIAGNWKAVAFSGISTGIVTILLSFLALEGTMAAYKRRRNILDEEGD